MTAINAGNAIVASECFVDVRVVRAQQLEDAAILTNRVANEQFGLDWKRLQQGASRIADVGVVGRILVQEPQIQPLGGEPPYQRSGGPGVRQHSPGLLAQDLGIRERSRLRE